MKILEEDQEVENDGLRRPTSDCHSGKEREKKGREGGKEGEATPR